MQQVGLFLLRKLKITSLLIEVVEKVLEVFKDVLAAILHLKVREEVWVAFFALAKAEQFDVLGVDPLVRFLQVPRLFLVGRRPSLARDCGLWYERLRHCILRLKGEGVLRRRPALYTLANDSLAAGVRLEVRSRDFDVKYSQRVILVQIC